MNISVMDVIIVILALIGLYVVLSKSCAYLFFDAEYDEQQRKYDEEQANRDKEAMLAAANAEVKAWRENGGL